MSKATPSNKALAAVSSGTLVARLVATGELVNLAGNYDYLAEGYYLSQDYENNGETIRPSCKDMLDAYIPPLFLEKAERAGLPIPEHYLSNGYIDPPVIADPINPFTLKGRVILKAGRAKTIAKSLTRNFTYAICCQDIPAGFKVTYFNAILGWSTSAEYREYARLIWETYNIPLAKIRVITDKSKVLLSDISPLFLSQLNKRESNYLKEQVKWDS